MKSNDDPKDVGFYSVEESSGFDIICPHIFDAKNPKTTTPPRAVTFDNTLVRQISGDNLTLGIAIGVTL